MTEEQALQIRKLREKGLGYKSIANMVNLPRDSVRNYCKSKGLSGYKEAVQMNIKDRMASGDACVFCGGPVKKAHTGRPRRFCSDTCRRYWWRTHRAEGKKGEDAIYTMMCPYCGTTFESYGNKNRKYCCHEHYVLDRFGGEKKDGV